MRASNHRESRNRKRDTNPSTLGERKDTMNQMNKLENINTPLQASLWEWETNIHISRTGRTYRDVLRFNKRGGRFSRVARCIEAIFSRNLYEAIQRANPVPRPRKRGSSGLWLQNRVEYGGRYLLDINGPVTMEIQTIIDNWARHNSNRTGKKRIVVIPCPESHEDRKVRVSKPASHKRAKLYSSQPILDPSYLSKAKHPGGYSRLGGRNSAWN